MLSLFQGGRMLHSNNAWVKRGTWAAMVLAGGLLAACDKAQPPAPAASAAVADAAPAPAAEPAAPAAATAASLESLRAQIGKYPSDAGADYLRQGPLAERLKTLLGADYEVLLTNLGTSGPLEQQGDLLFVTGNKPHEGGDEQAAVVVDLAHNAIRVWLAHAGQEQDKSDPATATVAWPSDVQAIQSNHKDMKK
jgi:pyruvate/2-oxoglutarate dehydrogenase complex dihydrolipoamide acyltransferase (E2) component